MFDLNNEVLRLYSNAAASPEARGLAGAGETDLFERRKQALLKLVAADPSAALAAALPDGIAARLAKTFPGEADKIEQYGSLTGVLEVEVEDGAPGDSQVFRGLRVGGRRLELHLTTAEPDVDSGQLIEVGGFMLGESVVAESVSSPLAKLDINQANAASCSTTGAQRVAVIKVKFPNTGPSLSNANLSDWMFGSSGETLNRFWQENSAGAAWAEGDVFPAGADAWYTLNREYSCSESSALRDAALAAANKDVDFRNYSRVIIVFTRPSTGCSFAGRASVGCWVANPDGGSSISYALQVLSSMGSRSSSVQLSSHEGGHQLGLYHSASMDYGGEALGNPSASGSMLEYGDRYATMGFWSSGHYAAPHKARLGWLQNQQVVSSSGTYRLQPYSLAPNSSGGAMQALKVQRGSGGGKTIWVEFRRRLGQFFSTAVSSPVNGALMHLDNGSTQSLLLDFTPQSQSSSGSYYAPDFYDATLNVGSSWQDPYTDLKLSVISASDSGLDVQVSYGSTPTCTPASPQVSVSPTSESADYPAAASYQVAITNKDSAGCNSGSFSLSSSALLGSQTTGDISTQLSQGQVTLAPGASGAVTLSAAPMTAPPQATNYQIKAMAQRGGNQGAAQAGLVIVPPPNTAPTVTITAPANGAKVTEGTSFSFSGSAGDAEDGDLSATVAWTSNLDGALGTGSSLSKALTVGTHAVTASVKDAGGLSASKSISVTVDPQQASDTAPTLTINSPANGAKLTEGTPVNFSGTATDKEDGDLSNKILWISNLDGFIGAGGAISKALTAGSHTLTVSVVDSGNQSALKTITVTVDPKSNQNTAPTVTINSPANGAKVTEGTAISFSGSAADQEDGNLSAKISWQSSLSGAIGTGAALSKALPVGSHVITASVKDAGGLSAFKTVSVTVEAAAVTDVAITAVSAPASVTQGNIAAVAVTVQNLGSQDVGAIPVSLSPGAGGGAVVNSPQSISGLAKGATKVVTFSWNTATATAATHTLTASLAFSDGNASNNVRSTSSKVNAAATPFNVTAISPNSVVIGSTAIVKISGAGFQSGAKVSFQNGSGKTPQAVTVAFVNSSLLVATITAPGGGPNSNRFWDVVVSNPAGSSAVLPQALTVLAGSRGNSKPRVAVASPSNEALYPEGQAIAFSGTAADDEDGSLTSSLVWTSTIDGPIGTGGSFTKVLSRGAHIITASVTDSAGETTSSSVALAVQAPVTGPSVGAFDVMITMTNRGPNLTGHAAVRVVSGTGMAAPAAVQVEGVWMLDDVPFGVPVVGLTDATGTALIDSVRFRASRGSQLTFTVTKMVQSGATWNGLPVSGIFTVP